jgi:glutamate-ammonia-ligase adenylyltransferase
MRTPGEGPSDNPLLTYDDIAPERLAALGFDDPAQACRVLRDMAGHDVPDAAFNAMLRAVSMALMDCADPDRAVSNLGRWADAVGSRASAYGVLAASPPAARMLMTIFAASQFFANLIIHTPEYLEVLTNPHIRDRERGPDGLWHDLTRRIGIGKTPNAKRDALRRFKPPEILRIGARDLLGYADMAETARALSDFADATLRMALQICADEQGMVDDCPFAIIAMGKLGGRELNYSSDVDLIFVHGSESEPQPNPLLGKERGPEQSERLQPEVAGSVTERRVSFHPVKLAEAIRGTMAQPTDAGFIFRVDLRLRPEGRFGPITRSIESCRAYYESWAEPWERQAMLKARFVAGDPEVGNAFMQIAESFAYRSRVEDAFVNSIRQNKRRIEDKIARGGESDRNVKEGRGGIRDIEFVVQLLQLIAGGRNPALRTPNTLDALDRLSAAGLLTEDERRALASSYIFLRDVEHRLQIMDELPVRNLPSDPKEIDRFGRRLGYADGGAFLDVYRAHTDRVHLLFERLFYSQEYYESAATSMDRLVDRILDAEPKDTSICRELTRMGFADPRAAIAIVRHDFFGSEYGEIQPGARAAFVDVADAIMIAAAGTSDPDAALRGIDALAVAVPSRQALYRSLSESHNLLPKLAHIAAESPPLWQTLIRRQELLDLISEDEAMDTPLTRPAPVPATEQALAQWVVRARLRTGARDIWGLAHIEGALRDTTTIAEVALCSALAMAVADNGGPAAIAIVGMGKLGGGELGYASDYDVLYVAAEEELAAASRVVKRLQQILKNGLAAYGVSLDVDARLRPDGRKGAMVLDIGSYQRYWRESAALWERQAMLKGRFVAGDPALGKAFCDAAGEFVYGRPLTDDDTAEIRAMKRRIETERGHGPEDLKLGPGGLSDIEWTCQLLQLQYGPERPRLRSTNTLEALAALRDDVRVTQANWETLDATYKNLVRARNRAFLKAGVPADTVTPFPDRLRRHMAQARAVCDRVFYGLSG